MLEQKELEYCYRRFDRLRKDSYAVFSCIERLVEDESDDEIKLLVSNLIMIRRLVNECRDIMQVVDISMRDEENNNEEAG